MNDSARNAEQVIRFSPAKLLLLFISLAILVALSALINPDSWRGVTWPYWVFGGLAVLLVFGCVILPRRYYLHLTQKGFTIQYLTGQRHYTWDEVRHFRVAKGPTINRTPTGGKVVFDLTDESPHRTTAIRTLACVNGYDVSILATFSITAEELVGVLNEWQQRYHRS